MGKPGDVTLIPALNMVSAVVVLIRALVTSFRSSILKQRLKSDIRKNYPMGKESSLIIPEPQKSSRLRETAILYVN